MALINFTNKGLYCSQGDFYIDPWVPVNKAIITHAHSDHARGGSQSYLCHQFTTPILQLRLGDHHYQSVQWGEVITINGVKVSLHPAGHIIGSSQVRLEYNGEVWVFSGDYKLEDDGISTAFEPIKCHTFITECTFGLPIYKWQPQAKVYNDIITWVTNNHQQQKTSIILAYSLGKAQRILQPLASTNIPIYGHGAITNVHQMLNNNGWHFPTIHKIDGQTSKNDFMGNIIIAPQSADGTSWMKRFQPYNVGVCSGWMQVRGNARRNNVDAGFVLSDHADWDGLLTAVKATGAQQVFTTHGFKAAFSRYLNENGIAAQEVVTQYGDETTNEDNLPSITN